MSDNPLYSINVGGKLKVGSGRLNLQNFLFPSAIVNAYIMFIFVIKEQISD